MVRKKSHFVVIIIQDRHIIIITFLCIEYYCFKYDKTYEIKVDLQDRTRN